ncbi:MAG: DUF262 domain-containing protein [Gammaproteobacteria bacterium]|nr:MAG: DUF262 domain-containing protein [Gammaproteobacteria bacterium]
MRTGKSTVKDIFDGTRIFNIPIYQRAYSWEKEDNLRDFLADIVNQHPDRSYFLGSLLFHINGNRNEFVVIDIVDGQQRLTTFVIFINILIQKLIEKSSSLVSGKTKRIFVKDDDVFKLETSNEDSAFLHNIVLSQTEVKEIKTNTLSQRLLLEAKEFFTKELGKYDLNILEKIYTTSTNAEVLLYVVDKINAATQIFELLNDRGRKLTDLESIKSFLMYNAGLVSRNSDQIIRNIQTDFAEIYRILEKWEINDRDVLRYHTIAYEGCPADYQEKPKEFIKNKIIKLVSTENSKKEAINEIQNYSSRLKNSFVIYSRIQENKKKEYDLSRLFMIGRVAPFYPVLMRIYKEQRDKFNDLVNLINRSTFRASLIGLRSNGESYLYTTLRNNEDVITLIDRFISNNWWDINKRAQEAIEYENYYERFSKNTVRYILFSYENMLRSKKGFPLLGLSEYFTSIDRERLSIEHISAQRAKNVKYDDEFNERYMHSIGNLVIDYAASNSSKGNKNTKDKLQAFKLAPLMSQNEIDEIECDWENVDSVKTFIREREEKLRLFIKNLILLNENT